MEKIKIINSLAMHYRCNYSHFLKIMMNKIYGCHLFRDFRMYKDLTYPILIEGDLKRKGANFIVRRPDLRVIIFYKVIESVVTDYYCNFKFEIYKTIPETFEYIHQVEVRYVNEDECFIKSTLFYNEKIVFSDKDIKSLILFEKTIYKSIESSLRKFIIFKLSVVYTLINSNIEIIWDIIRNLKLVNKFTHLLCDKINYKGNAVEENSIIELIKVRDKKNIKSIAKINNCKFKTFDLIKEFIIELLFHKEKDKNKIEPFSERKIIIRGYEYNGKCTIYLFYYFFNNHLSTDLEKFNKMKSQELEKFKNIIEHYKASSINKSND